MVNVNYLTDQPGLFGIFTPENFELLERRGPRAAHLELPGGGRLLPHAFGPAGARRRVPLRGRAVLRRGPHAAARQRLCVRPGDHQAHVARQGRPAHADAGLEADGALQLPDDGRGSREHRSRACGSRSRSRRSRRSKAIEREPLSVPASDSEEDILDWVEPREPDRVPPDVDVRDGRRRRLGAARLRRRRAPRRRRLGDADDHAREHARGDDHDRGEGAPT